MKRARVVSVCTKAAGLENSARLPWRPLKEEVPWKLHSYTQRRGVVQTPRTRPKTAVYFPGQGAQKVGMLAPWKEAFPQSTARHLDQLDSLMGYKISKIIEEGPSKALTPTPVSQPATMAASIIILRILREEWGFRVADHADVTLGHSLGEFAALVCSDYLEYEDALNLVAQRAKAMAEATQQAMAQHGGMYGMVAVVVDSPEKLGPLIASIEEFVGQRLTETAEDRLETPPIDQVLIALINSSNQIVLSGNLEKIAILTTHIRQLLGADPRVVRLNLDCPVHSPIMKPTVSVMEQLLRQPSRVSQNDEDVIKWPGTLSCMSGVTARPFESRAQLRDLLARQGLETIRWWDTIRYLDKEEKVRRWIGIGPDKVGRNLVGKEVGMRSVDAGTSGGVWAITEPAAVDAVLKGLQHTERFVTDEPDE